MNDKINSGISHLHKEWKQRSLSKTSNASIVVVCKNGVVQTIGMQACHGGLSRSYSSPPEYIISGIQRPSERMNYRTEDSEEVYLNYLLNDSPFANAFVTKDAKEALAQECVVARADLPSNIMAAGLVSTRRVWEFPHISRITADLIKHGVNPDLAFLISHYCYPSDGLKQFAWCNKPSQHNSIDVTVMDKKAIKRFLDHKPLKTKLNSNYSKSSDYRGYCEMWTDAKPGPSLIEFVKGIELNNNNSNKSINPFLKSKKSAESDLKLLSYPELLLKCKEVEDKIMKEVGYV